MPIRITRKYKEGGATVVEGTAQLLDDTISLDEPVVLQECQWKATMALGQALWDIEIQSGNDLRGYVQTELQRRTKKK